MERVTRLLQDAQFAALVQRLASLEAQRPYCRHDMDHFLSVARIAHILNLEEGAGQPKELLYAAALVHDLGRVAQYEKGTPHEEAGALLAGELLTRAGFAAADVAAVQGAIAAHRAAHEGARGTLASLLYRADKLSRPCLLCQSRAGCNWPDELKNVQFRY